MELIRDLRRNGLLIAVKALVMAVFAVSLYTFGTFAQSTSGAVNGSLAADRDVDLYGLVDTFLGDTDGFERFRASDRDLRTLTDFVAQLGHNDRLDFLSAFDQPVVIEDFRGDGRFDANAGSGLAERGEYRGEGGERLRDVKSMQMNHEMFAFSRLDVTSGSAPVWTDVDYSSGLVPVVLGSDYRGLYEIGDELRADVYGVRERLQVTGFLSPGSAVFHRGDINHYLDDTVVLPYPADVDRFVQQDRYTGGIVAFAMLNTDIAASTSMTYDDVTSELSAIAARTGFHSYSLQGIPTYLVQLRLVRQIVIENFGLLGAVSAMTGVATIVVCRRINRVLGDHRRRWVGICRTVGRSDRAILRTVGQTWAVEYSIVVVLYAVGCALLPNHHAYPFLGVMAALGVWFSLDAVSRAHRILATETPGRWGR